VSRSSIGGIGSDKERQRRDKPSRKASCRVEWGEVQQDLLGKRQRQVGACKWMAERMSEQVAREGQEDLGFYRLGHGVVVRSENCQLSPSSHSPTR
jgi:hypothetical protein